MRYVTALIGALALLVGFLWWSQASAVVDTASGVAAETEPSRVAEPRVQTKEPVKGGLSKEDLAHGHAQVRNMLRDRPQMALLVSEGDAIWTWAARRFAGENIGYRVYWSNRVPKRATSASDSRGPSLFQVGDIRVRALDATTPGMSAGESLWAKVIFELINHSNDANFKRAYAEALAGQLSRQEWIRKNTRLEHGALLIGAEFYETVWKPWATERGLPMTPRLWRVGTPSDYETWVSRFGDRTTYPWNSWGAWYDENIARLKQK